MLFYFYDFFFFLLFLFNFFFLITKFFAFFLRFVKFCFRVILRINNQVYFFFFNRLSFFFLCGFPILLPDESTYYLFSFLYDFFFFSYLFLLKPLAGFLCFFFYYLVIFFFSFFSFLLLHKFFSLFFFSFFIVMVIVLGFFLFFIFYLILNFLFFLMSKFFGSSIPSFFILSKDFVSVEEEDLWISSNIFYLDFKIIEAERFNIKLKVSEISVFFTLIDLFFDTQKINLEYLRYSNDLNNAQNYIDRRKFFKQYSDTSSRFNLNREFNKLREQQKLGNFMLNPLKSEFFGLNFLHFYKKVFKSSFLISENSHLFRKKESLKIKQARNRNFQFSVKKNFYKTNLNSRIASSLLNARLSRNSFNDVVFLKSLKIHRDRVKEKDIILKNITNSLSSSKFRPNSRLLKFFWFSFPGYLFKFNYFVFFFNWFLASPSIFFKKCWYRFLFFLYSFFDPAITPSFQFSKKFFKFKDFSVTDRKNIDLSFFRLIESFFFVFQDAPNNNLKNDFNQQFFGITDISTQEVKKSSQKDLKKQFKNKRDYYKISRKPFTSSYIRLISSNNGLNFINDYTSSFMLQNPNLRLIDLHKILEYFYFIILSDSDFFENVTFAAKVAVLKEKYGEAIVNDLLSTGDHKQAKHVNFQLSAENSFLPLQSVSSKDGIKSLSDSDGLSKTSIFNNKKDSIKEKFKYKSFKFSPTISTFSRQLLLSFYFR